MQIGFRSPLGLGVAAAVAAGVVLAAAAIAATPKTQTLRAVDTRLCPFELGVALTRNVRSGPANLMVVGPTRIVLRNVATGRKAVLDSSGTATLDPKSGGLRFRGSQLMLGDETFVPYLSTRGAGSLLPPHFVLAGATGGTRVIDPCALVADEPPSTEPRATRAPWALPAFALSQIAYAGLTPLVGKPTRHDHMHLDVIVDGKRVTVPAGIGQAGPVDRGPGPCPPPPESRTIGDCAPGHYFTAEVAASQLQTHTSSGIVHLQAERPGKLRLGQFFDEWGVRFDRECLGGHCAGGGKELRVYVGGRRMRGDPRKLVLRDQQVIAVVYGGPAAFRSVPSEYPLRWPTGCGGPGERSCFIG